ncbi:MAG: HAMP domain-containing sensor histidine kinase [Gemmatimonadota bacterium]
MAETTDRSSTHRKANRDARRALQARDRILGTVAHDLRNPLNTIIMSAGLLKDLHLSEEQQRHQIEVILSSGRHMNRLIQDLLDVARVEGEHLKLNRELQAPSQLVREAVALNEARAAARSIDLRVGPCDRGVRISADRDRLLQVLSNLIDNAVKFSPEGCTVEVRAEAMESAMRFSVIDTGAGIPADDIAHLFESFWQGTRTSIEGAGLGLAIARGIVEAHGGDIGVDSTPGSGSTFFFTVPTVMAGEDSERADDDAPEYAAVWPDP